MKIKIYQRLYGNMSLHDFYNWRMNPDDKYKTINKDTIYQWNRFSNGNCAVVFNGGEIASGLWITIDDDEEEAIAMILGENSYCF